LIEDRNEEREKDVMRPRSQIKTVSYDEISDVAAKWEDLEMQFLVGFVEKTNDAPVSRLLRVFKRAYLPTAQTEVPLKSMPLLRAVMSVLCFMRRLLYLLLQEKSLS